MSDSLPLRAPAYVRHFDKLVDLTLAAITVVVFVAAALATFVQSPWDGAIQLALVLAVLMLFRRRWPMLALLLSIAAIFVYHLSSWSPAGWIWPASVVYFTAAATPRVRWAVAIGVAQLIYSAIDARWIIHQNLTRYLIHTVGEGLLLTVVIGAGLAYAATLRWQERQYSAG
ncbi:hypothetical protein [Nonomuraea roseoviolacea]|uniref:Sensor histidine kinase n=1 Tax=Nonomuraea roseoviolacea subsp. carminata TaxID=160689 RepID=A0ABT1JRR4_9ACTN|nr:hypothetical protein [Nonomuraea roseoviolacea]MCP2344019.1 hypothetical protein [Nonomuraea roseoviolacea subsp. carminata]